MFILLTHFAFADTCSTPIPKKLYATRLQDIENAIQDRDIKKVQEYISKASFILPCVIQPLDPPMVQRYFITQGLYYFLEQDKDKTQLFFSSAKSTGVEDSILESIYPSGHVIHQIYSDSPLIEDIEVIEKPSIGTIYIDGLEQLERPLYRPTLFQHVHKGKTIQAVMLDVAQDLPHYATGKDTIQYGLPIITYFGV